MVCLVNNSPSPRKVEEVLGGDSLEHATGLSLGYSQHLSVLSNAASLTFLQTRPSADDILIFSHSLHFG